MEIFVTKQLKVDAFLKSHKAMSKDLSTNIDVNWVIAVSKVVTFWHLKTKSGIFSLETLSNGQNWEHFC